MYNSFSDLDYRTKTNMDEQWGISVTKVGYQEVPPCQKSFQNIKHPSNYSIQSQTGQILPEYQLIYITQGEGSFRSRNIKETKLKEGNILIIFPGEWHIYQPKLETGWCVYWVGFKGHRSDKLTEANCFSKKDPILSIGLHEKLISLFQEILDYSKYESIIQQQSLAGTVTYILSQIYAINQNQKTETDNANKIVVRAKILMRENIYKQINPEDIAKSLNISYSLFRRLFKQHTGLAPGQYQQQLRVQKAKELLTISSKNIKEISFMLNFESDYYFSTYFKNRTGQTPSQFRKSFISNIQS